MININEAYKIARDRYAKWGVDTDKVIEQMKGIPLSVHCWQGDDVGGFEKDDSASSDMTVTGNYPGKARNESELMADFSFAMKQAPGKKKLSLHASYAITGGEKVERCDLQPKHFAAWVEYAKANGFGLDMNPTFFSHRLAASGATLSNRDNDVRNYWITHAIACRRIGDYFGKELGMDCVTNLWIADGSKDNPADRFAPRSILKDSLDKIYSEKLTNNKDAVESKLFGIGTESYVVGSHEFYLNYCMSNPDVMSTLDMGHFHPTEKVADKLSSILVYKKELLLHLSRPVRWDSDHVLAYDSDLLDVMHDIARCGYIGKINFSLDYFDASINRVAAWAIGARNAQKALLRALIEPTAIIKQAEIDGDLTTRLALTEEFKTYPHSAVWDYYCHTNEIPVGTAWLDEVKTYEKETLSKRV